MDVLALLVSLLRGKKTILRFVAAGVLLAAVAAFLMKPVYTAEASFVPPSSNTSGMAALAGQLGALGLGSGATGAIRIGDVYAGILGSRTVADDLIVRFDLQKVYRVKPLSAAEAILKARSNFGIGLKDSIVTITVEDLDPQRARDIANGYLDELHTQNSRLALTEAAQRRLFFEQQLELEKNTLADAEVDLKKSEESSGFIAPVGQTAVEIQTVAQTRAEIAIREVQLAALRQGATDQNPEIVRLRSEIEDLQGQLNRLQASSGGNNSGLIPTSKVPAIALDYIRKEREVKYHETLFDLIARQYEAARLDESHNAPILQVLDYAIIPDHKTGPHRLLILAAGALAGAMLGSFWVLARNSYLRLKENPKSAAKLATLREAASSR